MAIAMRDSVTVSMAAEISGTATEISRVSREVVSTSDGMTSVSPGSSRTSSKVRPRVANFSGNWSVKASPRRPVSHGTWMTNVRVDSGESRMALARPGGEALTMSAHDDRTTSIVCCHGD